ncbi:MAG: response regulator transcription factor [Clostridia bacterium]|nr:response regulator transcription factor [Clostridia bacterium]MDE7328222.1 response regulator transcription factor [Clostridia bacterium]
MIRVLVAEDDIKLNKLVRTVLQQNGYDANMALNGQSALEMFKEEHYDLIVSDIMMPIMDGYALAENVRALNANVPIMFMTAVDDFDAKKKGFLLGIDDYMVKPIDTNELLLRVGALLRRSQIVSERKIVIGNTSLIYDSLTAITPEGEIELPQKEFYILYKLLSFAGKIFTRSQLMEEFWGADSDTAERTVDVHITRIREKFKNSSDFEIVTIRGLGYKAVKKQK